MKKILHTVCFTLNSELFNRKSIFIFQFNGSSLSLKQFEKIIIERCAESCWMVHPEYAQRLFDNAPVI